MCWQYELACTHWLPIWKQVHVAADVDAEDSLYVTDLQSLD
jgi:hypothetical protein